MLFNAIAVLFVISVIVLLKNENSSPAFFTNNNVSAVRSMVNKHAQHLRYAPSTMNRALQSASTDNPTRISSAKPLPGHHLNHNITHKKAWMHPQEVKGLKNEEVVMVVTSTEANEGYYIRERLVYIFFQLDGIYVFECIFMVSCDYCMHRIIASSRTWMRHFANVIVVIEGSNCSTTTKMLNFELSVYMHVHFLSIQILSRCGLRSGTAKWWTTQRTQRSHVTTSRPICSHGNATMIITARRARAAKWTMRSTLS